MQDAIIIRGSFAGLTAALRLSRVDNAVTVVDAGVPRNCTSLATRYCQSLVFLNFPQPAEAAT